MLQRYGFRISMLTTMILAITDAYNTRQNTILHFIILICIVNVMSADNLEPVGIRAFADTTLTNIKRKRVGQYHQYIRTMS